MIEQTDKLGRTVEFASIDEMIAYACGPASLADHLRSSRHVRPELAETDSFDQAIDMARKGWREGAEAIRQMTVNLKSKIEGSIPLPEPFFDVTGENIDISRVLSGEPENMYVLVDSGIRAAAPVAQIARIVINVSASQTIRANTFKQRGAAAIVLADVLERHRIKTSIDVVRAIEGRGLAEGETHEIRVPIKVESEPISIDKLAFTLAHPSGLRRMFWSIAEREPEAIRRRFGGSRDYGYGFPGISRDQGDVYIGSIKSNADWSDGLTLAWLQSTLTAFSISIEGVK